jgi:choline dehydrogenase-like flavoprotein
MTTMFDVVVVGSGAGGAPLACRLCEAGYKVLLVERGKAWQRSEFDRDEIEWSRRDRFIPSPRTDPHTRRSEPGQRAGLTTDGWISTVLGGGTVHMGAYLLRGHDDDAHQATRFANDGDTDHTALNWAVPFADFGRFYDEAERELGVSGAPASGVPPLSAHALSAKVDVAATQLGLASMPTPRGILSVPRPDDDRLPCAYRQLCASYGCPNDAKSSMPATFLRRAAKTDNLTVWTRAMALRVVRDPATKKATGVVVRHIDDQRDETVTANVVVIAAGALESARLLLLSGDGFNPTQQVGKHLWFSLFVEVNGFFARDKHGDVADLMTGSPFINRTIRADGKLTSTEQQKAKVDRTGMFQVSFVHDNPIHRAERLATESKGQGRLLWGRDLKVAMRKHFRGGRDVILEGFGESTPHPGTFIDLDPDVHDQFGLAVARITMKHHPRDRRVAAQLAADGTALLNAMGADDVNVVRALSETMVLQGGTCRFGTDAKTSVTTAAGHLHDTTNVYVSDGGSLPSSLTVPTTLTIVANSLRIARSIIANHPR